MVNIRELAQKIVFISLKYPKHNLTQIVVLLKGYKGADIDLAIYYAQDKGWIEVTDTGKVDENKFPIKSIRVSKIIPFKFGKDSEEMKGRVLLIMDQVAKDNRDVEEYPLTAFFNEFPACDLLIAIQELLNEGMITSYGITDDSNEFGKSDYTYYSLAKNNGKFLGKNDFKDQSKITVK